MSGDSVAAGECGQAEAPGLSLNEPGALRPAAHLGRVSSRAARARIARGGSSITLSAGTHQGRWYFGKTPMQTFLDAMPMANEKMIAA
jgi:hypothetical protein